MIIICYDTYATWNLNLFYQFRNDHEKLLSETLDLLSLQKQK